MLHYQQQNTKQLPDSQNKSHEQTTNQSRTSNHSQLGMGNPQPPTPATQSLHQHCPPLPGRQPRRPTPRRTPLHSRTQPIPPAHRQPVDPNVLPCSPTTSKQNSPTPRPTQTGTRNHSHSRQPNQQLRRIIMVTTILDDGTQTTRLQTVGATPQQSSPTQKHPKPSPPNTPSVKTAQPPTASAATPTSATTNTLSNSCTTTATASDDSTPPTPATQTTSTTYSGDDQ